MIQYNIVLKDQLFKEKCLFFFDRHTIYYSYRIIFKYVIMQIILIIINHDN